MKLVLQALQTVCHVSRNATHCSRYRLHVLLPRKLDYAGVTTRIKTASSMPGAHSAHCSSGVLLNFEWLREAFFEVAIFFSLETGY